MSRRRWSTGVAGVITATALVTATAACGDAGPAEVAGFRRDPAPSTAGLTLPDLSDGGDDFELRADPGELLVVYFGYTNCPDFCPTTMNDLRLAKNRMDADAADRIDVAMVTVDPERDVPVLADYVHSFFDDGHALGTDDEARLQAAAAPFGVAYQIERDDDGQVAEVGHTTSLYAIDDQARVVLTWQFGVPVDDLASDLDVLLDETEERS